MANKSTAWRTLRAWWAPSLALLLYFCTSSAGVCSEQLLVATLHSALESPAPSHASESTKAGVADAKILYLTEQLITERFEAARLSIELADAKAETAQIEEAFSEQSELLAALMAVLRTRDRQDAALRAQTAYMRQEMEAVQAELQHKREENRRLAAELAGTREAAGRVKMMALGNLSVTRHPEKSVLHAAGASAALDKVKQPAQMLPAIWVHRLPAVPQQQTRLEGTK